MMDVDSARLHGLTTFNEPVSVIDFKDLDDRYRSEVVQRNVEIHQLRHRLTQMEERNKNLQEKVDKLSGVVGIMETYTKTLSIDPPMGGFQPTIKVDTVQKRLDAITKD